MSKDTQCYNEEGTTSHDIFCGFANLGTCCGNGWDCLSNGLCRQHDTVVYAQGACTDISFDPKYCLTFCDKTINHGYSGVSRCNDNSWCCGDNGNCCSPGNTTSLQPFPFSALLRASGQTNLASATSSSSSSLTSISLISSTLSASTSSSIPTPTATSPSSSTSSPGLSKGAKIGIGVAVPLGVLSFAALVFLLFQNRKSRRVIAALREMPEEKHDQLVPLNTDHEQGAIGDLNGKSEYELSNVGRGRHELGGRSSPSEMQGTEAMR